MNPNDALAAFDEIHNRFLLRIIRSEFGGVVKADHIELFQRICTKHTHILAADDPESAGLLAHNLQCLGPIGNAPMLKTVT